MLKKAKVLSSKKILDVGFFSVDKDLVELPNGLERTNHVVRFNEAVSIALLDAEGRIGLLKQYRYPFDEYLWEIPAGMVNKEEKPVEVAQRELAEELGYLTHDLTKIITYYPLCSVANPIMSIFLARDAVKSDTSLEEGEIITQIDFISLNDAKKMILNGEIKNAYTIIAILMIPDLVNT